MLRKIRSKIGLRMMAIFLLTLTLSAVLLLYGTKWLNTELEKLHTFENETHLKKQAYAFLSHLTYEQAMRYQAVFRRIETASALIARQAGFFMDHIDMYGKMPLNPNETLTVYPPNKIFSNDSFEITMVMYWGASLVSQEIKKELNALSHVDPLLIETRKRNPECAAAYIVTESGIRRHFPNAYLVTELPSSEEYGMRHASIHTVAKPENNPERRTVWTTAYQDDAGRGLVITAATPVHNRMGQYVGIAGVDVMLKSILDDILDNKSLNRFLSVKRGRDLTDSLFSFLVDHTGRIIAFPREYLNMLGLESDKHVNADGFSKLRLSASSDPEVRRMGNLMLNRDEHFSRFFLDGHPYIVSSHSMMPDRWRLAVVVPEAAVLGSLQKTLHEISSPTNKMTLGFTSAISLLLMVLVTLMMIASIRYIMRPRTADASLTAEDNEEKQMEDDLTADDLTKNGLVESDFMEDDLMEEYLLDDDLVIENGLTAENGSAKPGIDLTEQEDEVFLTHSYNKMVKTLQKLNELEKEHSIELQKEIAERRRVEDEIRHLSTRLISSSEEGKKELAQDLHDEFGQTLAALHMNAESLQHSIPDDLENHKQGIGDLIALIEHLGDKIRSISSDLRPDLLDDLGLVPTLEWYIKEFMEKRQDIDIDFQAVGLRRRLSSETELVLYRIFQESMNNVVKHAQAKHVDVTLAHSHPNVIFVIKDDGAGFDEQTRGKDGIGLLGMRERIVAVKGDIDIRSSIGKGTTIRVEVPVT